MFGLGIVYVAAFKLAKIFGMSNSPIGDHVAAFRTFPYKNLQIRVRVTIRAPLNRGTSNMSFATPRHLGGCLRFVLVLFRM
jgi:hypothetical protein